MRSVQTAKPVTNALEPLRNLGGLSIFEALEDFLATKNSLGTRRTYDGTLTGLVSNKETLSRGESVHLLRHVEASAWQRKECF